MKKKSQYQKDREAEEKRLDKLSEKERKQWLKDKKAEENR